MFLETGKFITCLKQTEQRNMQLPAISALFPQNGSSSNSRFPHPSIGFCLGPPFHTCQRTWHHVCTRLELYNIPVGTSDLTAQSVSQSWCCKSFYLALWWENSTSSWLTYKAVWVSLLLSLFLDDWPTVLRGFFHASIELDKSKSAWKQVRGGKMTWDSHPPANVLALQQEHFVLRSSF